MDRKEIEEIIRTLDSRDKQMLLEFVQALADGDEATASALEESIAHGPMTA